MPSSATKKHNRAARKVRGTPFPRALRGSGRDAATPTSEDDFDYYDSYPDLFTTANGAAQSSRSAAAAPAPTGAREADGDAWWNWDGMDRSLNQAQDEHGASSSPNNRTPLNYGNLTFRRSRVAANVVPGAPPATVATANSKGDDEAAPPPPSSRGSNKKLKAVKAWRRRVVAKNAKRRRRESESDRAEELILDPVTGLPVPVERCAERRHMDVVEPQAHEDGMEPQDHEDGMEPSRHEDEYESPPPRRKLRHQFEEEDDLLADDEDDLLGGNNEESADEIGPGRRLESPSPQTRRVFRSPTSTRGKAFALGSSPLRGGRVPLPSQDGDEAERQRGGPGGGGDAGRPLQVGVQIMPADPLTAALCERVQHVKNWSDVYDCLHKTAETMPHYARDIDEPGAVAGRKRREHRRKLCPTLQAVQKRYKREQVLLGEKNPAYKPASVQEATTFGLKNFLARFILERYNVDLPKDLPFWKPAPAAACQNEGGEALAAQKDRLLRRVKEEFEDMTDASAFDRYRGDPEKQAQYVDFVLATSSATCTKKVALLQTLFGAPEAMNHRSRFKTLLYSKVQPGRGKVLFSHGGPVPAVDGKNLAGPRPQLEDNTGNLQPGLKRRKLLTMEELRTLAQTREELKQQKRDEKRLNDHNRIYAQRRETESSDLLTFRSQLEMESIADCDIATAHRKAQAWTRQTNGAKYAVSRWAGERPFVPGSAAAQRLANEAPAKQEKHDPHPTTDTRSGRPILVTRIGPDGTNWKRDSMMNTECVTVRGYPKEQRKYEVAPHVPKAVRHGAGGDSFLIDLYSQLVKIVPLPGATTEEWPSDPITVIVAATDCGADVLRGLRILRRLAEAVRHARRAQKQNQEYLCVEVFVVGLYCMAHQYHLLRGEVVNGVVEHFYKDFADGVRYVEKAARCWGSKGIKMPAFCEHRWNSLTKTLEAMIEHRGKIVQEMQRMDEDERRDETMTEICKNAKRYVSDEQFWNTAQAVYSSGQSIDHYAEQVEEQAKLAWTSMRMEDLFEGRLNGHSLRYYEKLFALRFLLRPDNECGLMMLFTILARCPDREKQLFTAPHMLGLLFSKTHRKAAAEVLLLTPDDFKSPLLHFLIDQLGDELEFMASGGEMPDRLWELAAPMIRAMTSRSRGNGRGLVLKSASMCGRERSSLRTDAGGKTARHAAANPGFLRIPEPDLTGAKMRAFLDNAFFEYEKRQHLTDTMFKFGKFCGDIGSSGNVDLPRHLLSTFDLPAFLKRHPGNKSSLANEIPIGAVIRKAGSVDAGAWVVIKKENKKAWLLACETGADQLVDPCNYWIDISEPRVRTFSHWLTQPPLSTLTDVFTYGIITKKQWGWDDETKMVTLELDQGGRNWPRTDWVEKSIARKNVVVEGKCKEFDAHQVQQERGPDKKETHRTTRPVPWRTFKNQMTTIVPEMALCEKLAPVCIIFRPETRMWMARVSAGRKNRGKDAPKPSGAANDQGRKFHKTVPGKVLSAELVAATRRKMLAEIYEWFQEFVDPSLQLPDVGPETAEASWRAMLPYINATTRLEACAEDEAPSSDYASDL
eukprot:g2073.t1